jgi:hypothetical protein
MVPLRGTHKIEYFCHGGVAGKALGKHQGNTAPLTASRWMGLSDSH